MSTFETLHGNVAAMQMHIPLIGVIVILAICALVGIGLLKLMAAAGNALLGRGNHSDSGSSGFLGTLVSLAGVLLLLLLLGGFFLAVRRESHAVHVTASAQTQREIADASAEVSRQLHESFRQLEHARDEIRDAARAAGIVQEQSALPAESSDADSDAEPAASASADNATAEVAQFDATASSDKVIVLQLTEGTLQTLFEGHGREWLQEIKDRLPDELHASYALIPLSATVGTTAPAAARPFAAADRIQSVLTTVASFIPEAQIPVLQTPVPPTTPPLLGSPDAGEASRAGVLAELADDMGPVPPPAWLSHPESGQLVVESRFVPDDDDGLAELHTAVDAALVDHIQGVMNRNAAAPRNWNHMVSLSLSNDALDRCVLDTWARYEILQTGDGPKPMRKTIALVAFPEDVERQALDEVQNATRRQRTGILAMSIGCLWSALVAAAVGVRIGRRQSRLARLFVAPVCIIAALGLGGAAVAMVGVSATGHRVDTPFDDVRYEYTIRTPDR